MKAISKIKHIVSEKQITVDLEISGSKERHGNGCFTEWVLWAKKGVET